ncbi:sensor histidine kinase [Streptomyces luteireticuli]|uniref:sensor histidine kinase n=1 Tax=Streptomyces luteireticuli TaxID=173858 RepID=UPI0035583064
MLDRLPTRVRTAILAGAAALALFGGGAWWLQQHLYDTRYAAVEERAHLQARAVARNLTPGKLPTRLFTDQPHWPYVVVTPQGAIGAHGGGAGNYQGLTGQLPPAPADAPPDWTITRIVRFGDAERPPTGTPTPRTEPDGTRVFPGGVDTTASSGVPLAHRSLTAVGASVEIAPGETTIFGRNGGRYTVYVFVLPDEARAAVDDLTPALWTGVPLAALLVAGTAYLSTRRALRPVEAIRSELAEIGERRLDRRVPVPPARDEISRMAVTTNETLDRLERSAAQQRRFVADASHELRSPITALRTQLEISLAHPDATDWPGATRDALAAARRVQTLADDLLFLTRPDASPRQDSLVDLAGLVRELAHEARAVRPGGPAITLRLPDVSPVRGHALHLTRLLRNLLDNALRHAHATVTISIDHARDTWHTRVHNDGSDIDPADRERIFERFTRLDESRSRDAGGSGLGLAIARDIAARHGGRLSVDDTPPGTGPAFLLDLPVARTGVDAVEQLRMRSPASGTAATRVRSKT